MEFALKFTIARPLQKRVLMPWLILKHFVLIVTEDNVMTWPNNRKSIKQNLE